jgi:glucose uptake protein GlcU
MIESIGFLTAAMAAIGWGSQFVLMKKLKRPDPYHFHVFMSIGIFLSSFAIGLAVNASLVPNPFGLFSGLIWGIGNVCIILTVNRIGLARGMSLVLGISILTSFLWGAFYFNEAIANIFMAIFGIALFLIGLPLVSGDDKGKKFNLAGIATGATSGLVFGAIFVPVKLGNVSSQDFLFSMALGILIGAAVLFAVKVRRTIRGEIFGSVSSGVVWGIANFAGLNAVALLGLAVGFPLTQLALLVSVAWGLLYFKEIKGKDKILKIVVGAIVLIAGAFLLAFSKI